jgi:hypothetical protein
MGGDAVAPWDAPIAIGDIRGDDLPAAGAIQFAPAVTLGDLGPLELGIMRCTA